MSAHPHASRFFLASCVALITTAMSFAIRGEILGVWTEQFSLTNAQVGAVSGAAFWGFLLSMVFGGPLCDVVGMGRLLTLAFVGHVAGTILTILAGGYWSLFASTLLVGMGNGLVEAACNPLVATLYPENKTAKLNLFHVWFPGGIVIGGLTAYLLQGMGMSWQVKIASMLIPAAIYGVMFFGMKFPPTERVASGVSTAQMFKAAMRPLFLVMAFCMLLTAATELGTNQWIAELLSGIGVSGILILCWINGLMALGRMFAGPVVHRLAPAGMLLFSAVFSALGLIWLSRSSGPASFAAATLFAVGICYFWPTMLGFVAEYVPRSGALGLAIMGGIGAGSTAIAQPFLGWVYDQQLAEHLPAGATVDGLRGAAPGSAEAAVWAQIQAAAGSGALATMAVLPVILIVCFTGLYLWQRGKSPERLRA
ncbi:MAG: MFS transporter [Acidobacteria bacterium]|nr:MFS transporter [Acidobacteriota bacterium]